MQIIHFLLGFLSFAIPDNFETAIVTAVGYLSFFTGILPVQEILTAVFTLLSFMVLWYGAKLAMKLFHMIPWVGKKIDLK